jgi:hypothetical protein
LSSLTTISPLSFTIALVDGRTIGLIGEASNYIKGLSEEQRRLYHWVVAIRMLDHALKEPSYLRIGNRLLPDRPRDGWKIGRLKMPDCDRHTTEKRHRVMRAMTHNKVRRYTGYLRPAHTQILRAACRGMQAAFFMARVRQLQNTRRAYPCRSARPPLALPPTQE